MKVLIIHSHSYVRNNLKTVLENEYFCVDAVPDIRNGVVFTCVNEYDVIVVEHALPHNYAEWFCTEVRNRGRTAPILVLVMDDDAAGLSCLDKGADDFMRGAFLTQELVLRTRCLTRRAPDIHADIVTVGHVTIDRRARVVKCSGREAILTRKEFMILEFLALNQGAIVSKSEIIEHNWPESEDQCLSGAVDTHIYRLRKKIERRGRRLIQNIMGRGYRIG